MDDMGCPYIKELKRHRFCNASMARIMPSIEEQRTRCATDDYDNCPLFMAHILRHGSRKGSDLRRSICTG